MVGPRKDVHTAQKENEEKKEFGQQKKAKAKGSGRLHL